MNARAAPSLFTRRKLAAGAALAVLFSATALSIPTPAVAQSAYFFPQAAAGDFDPAIPTPEAFLGYPIGTHYTRHDRIADYLRELARLSDRVTVEEIGRSYEERPLLSVVITSGANQGRIDQIQRAHIAAGDPGGPAAAGLDSELVQRRQ